MELHNCLSVREQEGKCISEHLTANTRVYSAGTTHAFVLLLDEKWTSDLKSLKVPPGSMAQHMGHRTWQQENQGYARAPELAQDLRYPTPLCRSTFISLGKCFEISQCMKLLAKSRLYVVSCVPQMYGPSCVWVRRKNSQENRHVVNQRGQKCLDVPITRCSKKFACAHPYLWFILRSYTRTHTYPFSLHRELPCIWYFCYHRE